MRGLWHCWSPSFAFRYWAQLAHGAFYDAILAHYLRKHYILCTVIIYIHKKENSCIYCNIFSRISSEWTVVLTQNRDRIVLRPSVALSLAWPHLWSTVMHLHSHEQGYRYMTKRSILPNNSCIWGDKISGPFLENKVFQKMKLSKNMLLIKVVLNI